MTWMFVCNRCNGILDAQGGRSRRTSKACSQPDGRVDVEFRVALLDQQEIRRRRRRVEAVLAAKGVRGMGADDWNIRKRLTLNLGVRYDLETGVFAEHIEFLRS